MSQPSPTPLLLLLLSFPLTLSTPTCRSYCGNITIDYPFGLKPNCGHSIFHNLLFCINNVLLLHIPSGSYRILAIDYPFRRLTLNDPTIARSYSPRGFILNPWLSQFLLPAPENLFFLIDCQHDSRLVCRNVSGYYGCLAWEGECCAVGAGEVREVNLRRMGCKGYRSVYSDAPVREWMDGIRVAWSVPGEDEEGCRACEMSGGSCGYDGGEEEEEGFGGVIKRKVCICGGGNDDAWNSTSTCESRGMAFIFLR